jgi:hypothetical protein
MSPRAPRRHTALAPPLAFPSACGDIYGARARCFERSISPAANFWTKCPKKRGNAPGLQTKNEQHCLITHLAEFGCHRVDVERVAVEPCLNCHILLATPKSAHVDDLSTSSGLAGFDSRNFAAPVHQILARIIAHTIRRQSRTFSHSLGHEQPPDNMAVAAGSPPRKPTSPLRL